MEPRKLQLQPAAKPVLLVLDDDDAIENLVRSASARQGCDVWLADSGSEAIRLLRNRPPATAVVLTGRSLPDAQRLGLLPLLQKLMPEARCCFLTDRSADERVSESLAFVLARPADLAELSRRCTGPSRRAPADAAWRAACRFPRPFAWSVSRGPAPHSQK